MATTYYVTQTGSGSRDGLSPANTWSIATFNATTVPVAGDTVVFTGTFTSQITPIKGGTATARVTLDMTQATLNYSSNPRISIQTNFLNILGGTLTQQSGGDQIDMGGGIRNDITIDGWTFIGSITGLANFIYCQKCFNLLISNCHVDNSDFIFGDTTSNHDITIRNCFARTPIGNGLDNQLDLIKFGDATNVIIEGCYLENQAHSFVGNGHQDVVQNYQSGATPNGEPGNWILRYNFVVMNDHDGGSGDNSFLMLQGMNGTPALTIHNNVFCVLAAANTGNNGIVVTRDSGGTYLFYNNTVIRHSAAGNNTIRFEDAGTLISKNNIGMADPGVGGSSISWTMLNGGWDYNFFFQFPSASAGVAGTHGSITVDPLFTNYAGNDFSLSASSPLIGKGVNLGPPYDLGIAPGATWPNPALLTRGAVWEPGAYVYGIGGGIIQRASATIAVGGGIVGITKTFRKLRANLK